MISSFVKNFISIAYGSGCEKGRQRIQPVILFQRSAVIQSNKHDARTFCDSFQNFLLLYGGNFTQGYSEKNETIPFLLKQVEHSALTDFTSVPVAVIAVNDPHPEDGLCIQIEPLHQLHTFPGIGSRSICKEQGAYFSECIGLRPFGVRGCQGALRLRSCKVLGFETLSVEQRRAAILGLGEHKQPGFFRIPPHIILYHFALNQTHFSKIYADIVQLFDGLFQLCIRSILVSMSFLLT